NVGRLLARTVLLLAVDAAAARRSIAWVSGANHVERPALVELSDVLREIARDAPVGVAWVATLRGVEQAVVEAIAEPRGDRSGSGTRDIAWSAWPAAICSSIESL